MGRLGFDPEARGRGLALPSAREMEDWDSRQPQPLLFELKDHCLALLDSTWLDVFR